MREGSSVLAGSDDSNGELVAGAFQTETVTYTSGANPPSGNLAILLASYGDQIDFKNVALTTSTPSPPATVNYYFADHLGSASVVTDAAGTIQEESDYYPFGGERVVTDLGIGNNYKFTGKERDAETGLDDFGARYYSSAMGRFVTPDWSSSPSGVPYADLTNPQSLNLYLYVENNPESLTDPIGHWVMSTAEQAPLADGESTANCDQSGQNCAAQQQQPTPPQQQQQNPNSDPPADTQQEVQPPPAPAPPGPPAIVNYNGHTVSDKRVQQALSEMSRFFASNTINVTSGNRDFVPQGGAVHSPHLTGQAADFHVVGMSDSRADKHLKESNSPIRAGFRLIQHGPHTATQGAHLHIDSRNAAGRTTVYMHEGMTPRTRGVYSQDPNN